jgi:hypothetical protein
LDERRRRRDRFEWQKIELEVCDHLFTGRADDLAVGEWTGAAVADVLDRCRAPAGARYLVLRGFDEQDGRGYYETIDLELARHPQTILAYEMNGFMGPRRPSDEGRPRSGRCSLTIGHSTRTVAELVALLRPVEVTLLVDVRSIPRSRHTPQFNRDTLPALLAAEGIGYRHESTLGGRRHHRKGAPPSRNGTGA